MSRLTAVHTHRAGPRSAAPARPLRRVRRIGYTLLGLQLAGFLAWSTLLYDRFAVSFDFAQFMQSWTLIAHGHLDPFDTVHTFPFWKDHSEFLVWPLAALYWAWPHGVTLLWVQDLCVVAAEAVVFTWLCETAVRYRPGRDAALLASAGLVLLLADPWTWWAVSFDFHTESLAVPFVALILWDFSHRRRRAWVWVVPLLLCGDVACTYVAAIGLGMLLAGRRLRWQGAAMAVLGIAAVLVITLVHGNAGSGGGLRTYAYLSGLPADGQVSTVALVKGMALHPLGAVHALWAKRANLWAVTAPSGLIGLGSAALLPFFLIVLLANNLAYGFLFSPPSFQYLPVYLLMPAGTVAVLGWLARRHRRTALVLTGLVLAQALAWTAVWLPRTPGQWLRVPAATAATLAAVQPDIPASAEVIASQGVMGRFSGRADVHALFGPGRLPVRGGQVWFVIVPAQGIETLQTSSAMALIGQLAGPLHATLVTHGHGVWVFRWRPPAGTRQVDVPAVTAGVPAWATRGAAGKQVISGPVASWHDASTGRRGYVDDGLEWLLPAGRYQAAVRLSASGPVNVEVWDDTGNVLLARTTVPPRTA